MLKTLSLSLLFGSQLENGLKFGGRVTIGNMCMPYGEAPSKKATLHRQLGECHEFPASFATWHELLGQVLEGNAKIMNLQ